MTNKPKPWRTALWMLLLSIDLVVGACTAAAATAAPTATITLSPSTIVSGGDSTITWSSTNATSCTASGNWAWSGTIATSGTEVTSQSGASLYTITYVIACTGAGGSASSTAYLTVEPPGTPAVKLTASPTTITSGGSSTLTWSSTNATSCTASGGWTGTEATSGTLAVSPTSTTTYALSCTGTDGTAQASATVTVKSASAPTVTLKATPATITTGDSSTLTWSSTNATSCTASGGWTGTEETSGTLTVAPTSTTTYTLTCTGTSGTARASTTVTVTTPPIPTVTLTANPSTLTSGSSSTLTWSSTHATACTASGAWSGTQPTSGNSLVSPTITGVSTYTLICSGTGGSNSASASITVNGAGQPVATVNPTTLTFASQATGTTSPAQTVSLTNTGTGTLSSIVISASGDFAQTNTCGTTLAATASCTISVTFTPTTTGALSGTLMVSSNSADGTASVSLSGTGTLPVTGQASPLISIGLPIYASSAAYPATNANGGNYNQQWRSNGVPVTLALDLSSVPVAERQSIWLVWYNDATYGYNHALIGQVGYNNPGAYTLAANAAPGGTAPPTTGWVQLASLSGNTLHSYSHNVNFAGYNWIQYTFTVSDGSPENTDIALNLDVYGSSNGVTDGWLFGGDSITANCMAHGNINAQDENNPSSYIVISALSFAQQVNAIVGNNTP